MTPREQRAPIGIGKLDYQDFLSLPEDDKRYEILDGELVVSAAPATRHQRVSRDLGVLLHLYVSAHRLGEVFSAPISVVLDKHTIVIPDLVYVSSSRIEIITERGIEGAPDLLVEILSPSTAPRDRGIKAKLYAQLGVDHYWIVDPKKRTLKSFEREGGTDGAGTLHRENEPFVSRLFPDLVIALDSLWG